MCIRDRLGAIEAYHSEHSARDERFCVELAARYGLGLSGGSDYHGMRETHHRAEIRPEAYPCLLYTSPALPDSLY